MTFPFLLACAAFAAAVALIFVVPVIRDARDKRLVACPETKRPAAVTLDGSRALLAMFRREPGRLRLAECSRWPEKAGCGQECLGEIERDQQACLVRNLVAEWYRDRSCAFCWKPVPAVKWSEHRPALLAPDGTTVSWTDVRPEQLPDKFSTHDPVCWDCHVVQSVVRERPDVVTVREKRDQLYS